MSSQPIFSVFDQISQENSSELVFGDQIRRMTSCQWCTYRSKEIERSLFVHSGEVLCKLCLRYRDGKSTKKMTSEKKSVSPATNQQTLKVSQGTQTSFCESPGMQKLIRNKRSAHDSGFSDSFLDVSNDTEFVPTSVKKLKLMFEPPKFQFSLPAAIPQMPPELQGASSVKDIKKSMNLK